MKAELWPDMHAHVDGAGPTCVEVWWQGELIGRVYGADGPGIRFISKHEIQYQHQKYEGQPQVLEVRVKT